ncbi:helix-turn-helix transcriptional regulator [Actinomadura xylanilytica]|uniref:helix-turn-helix transcriptional regulator n=1 Tax=Actinomadura xylanilytica TaxID=887459 RepID=UPI00255B34B4|nr:LuxR family transcriptional regulator [Actinomadura xylanilytica]MDL4773773.1 AAA family ATPase [Actinomadura xylanilytica]
MLHGRGTERAAIDALVDDVRAGRGRALVLRGQAGIGKSALLEYAAGAGTPVLRATGAEPDQGLAFAALHQLLRPVSGLAGALPEPQRDALRGALGLAASAGGDARFLVSAGVLSLLVEAAGDGGLLCLVDDFQWFDQASADALLFAARRLGGERVGMLIAAREGGDIRDLPVAKITGLAVEEAVPLLGDGAIRPIAERLVALTGGNPLALQEAARILTPGQLGGRSPLPDPLPAGADLFAHQVGRLPAATRLLLLVAAAEGQGDLDVVLRAAGRLEAGAEALQPAEASGLITVDGPVLRFRHPLIRSAAYRAPDRRRAHAALAETVDDPERRAWHRAEAAVGRQAGVADELAESAARASARGGYADAASALVKSAELTPGRELRARRLIDATTAAWLGGRPGLAETCLAEARELTGDPRRRAELAQLRGRFELCSGDASEAQRIFLENAGVDPARTLEMLSDAAEAASYVGDVAAIVDIGRQAEALPESFLQGMLVGTGALLGGDPERGAPLLRTWLRRADEPKQAAELLWSAAAATYLGEADASSEFIIRAGQVARVSGMVGQLPVVLEYVATAERVKGRFALSAALSEEGLSLAQEAGYANSAAAHLANLAAVAAIQGEEADCERHAHEALAIAIPHRAGLRVSVATYALGLLALGKGRFATAHARFAGMVTAGPGLGHPATVWRSTPDRVEAAVGCGELDAAREAVAAYERWAVNAETAQARALLLRCRALLEDGDKSLRLYEEALPLHSGAPFEEARTALLYGERLRRAHRPADARTPLRTAAESFQRAGAAPWTERALSELRAAGEAGAAPASGALNGLTPQELRIVRLVAEGATNREVAARLFLSPRTVEYHLYKVYPKLGVTSRTELSRYWTVHAQ